MYKKDVQLHQLSPLGEIIEEWILNGTYIVDSKDLEVIVNGQRRCCGGTGPTR